MPIYEYQCDECKHKFEQLRRISEGSDPCKEPCPECSAIGARKVVSAPTVGVDMNLTPNKKTGGDWNRLMDKIKGGTPKSVHSSLDRASDQTGGRLGPG